MGKGLASRCEHRHCATECPVLFGESSSCNSRFGVCDEYTTCIGHAKGMPCDFWQLNIDMLRQLMHEFVQWWQDSCFQTGALSTFVPSLMHCVYQASCWTRFHVFVSKVSVVPLQFLPVSFGQIQTTTCVFFIFFPWKRRATEDALSGWTEQRVHENLCKKSTGQWSDIIVVLVHSAHQDKYMNTTFYVNKGTN